MSGLRPLAELMAEHEGQEPARASWGVFNGMDVTVKCVLQRTAVIILPNEDEPRLVHQSLIAMDPDRVLWVKRRPIDWVGNENSAEYAERGRRKSLANRPRRKTA